MTAGERCALGRGVYVPVLSFFNNDTEESLDLATFERHVSWIAGSGVAGIVVLGSTGEAVALSEPERVQLIRSARKAMDAAGQERMPLIAGAGGHSVHVAVASLQAAYAAGASHALVLPASYYPAQQGAAPAITEFYTRIADASPMPILIYSYPGVSSGINMSSDITRALAQHANIRGIKHTDHDLGKMARNCALPLCDAAGQGFIVLGGASDYLVGALALGAHGTITGMGNIAPRAVVAVQQRWEAGDASGALKLQHAISVAEWELGKGGVPMHKALVEAARGYGGLPRSPLPGSAAAAAAAAAETFAELLAIERRLQAAAAK